MWTVQEKTQSKEKGVRSSPRTARTLLAVPRVVSKAGDGQ